LLEKDANVNQAKNDGESPLFVACASGKAKVARLLLAAGADINKSKDNGYSPFLIACLEAAATSPASCCSSTG